VRNLLFPPRTPFPSKESLQCGEPTLRDILVLCSLKSPLVKNDGEVGLCPTGAIPLRERIVHERKTAGLPFMHRMGL